MKINGKRRISSISNTKKIRVTKKNRKEIGFRLSLIVENPHSNGLSFSRSRLDFFLTKKIKRIITIEKKKAKNKFTININITI